MSPTKLLKVMPQCYECGKDLKNKNNEYDDEYYCEECFKAKFVKCANCHEICEKEEAESHKYDGEYYCESCFEENFGICHKCEEIVPSDDLLEGPDNNAYCESCYNERFFTCPNCGEVVRSSSGYETNSGELWCESCYSDNYTECANCGEMYHNEEMHYNDDDDSSYCDSCYNERGNRVVHDHGYKPSPDFKKMKWENTLYMGFELEVEHEEQAHEADVFVDFLQKEGTDERFYLKYDGSVEGFEIVSHPFTLQYAHKHMKLKRMCDWLEKHKYASYDGGNCGLHIHLDKKFFTELDLVKMRMFFSKNKSQIYKFSKRKGHGDSYCMYEDFNLRGFLRMRKQDGRYWALNFNTNQPTIEMRAFRGTLVYNRVRACLQFADALSHFVKEVGVTSLFIGERRYHQNSWLLFTDWCKEVNRYDDLVKQLKEDKLCV